MSQKNVEQAAKSKKTNAKSQSSPKAQAKQQNSNVAVSPPVSALKTRKVTIEINKADLNKMPVSKAEAPKGDAAGEES